MNFNQQLAKYVTGRCTSEDLPQIALIGLQEGLESESLTILAGMGSHSYPSDINSYFSKALLELNISLPDKRSAALIVSFYYVTEILNRSLEPLTGMGLIVQSLDSHNFFSESIEFAMDSIRFHHVYGLYSEYEDLQNPLFIKPERKTEQEMTEELCKQMITELVVWQMHLLEHELNPLPKSQ